MGTQAYTYPIDAIGGPNNTTVQSENVSVHQSSPAWVLTFIRWTDRDTLRIVDANNKSVRGVLVVENDCVQVSTTDSKGTLTPSMQATLVMTDVNYETAVAPGDFVFVNMLNWEVDSRRVANAARVLSPINGPDDGFKGFYKVQSVRRVEQVDPQTGIKTLLFRITGFAFTEFNNVIYFNPSLIDSTDTNAQLLFISNIAKDWSSLITGKGFFYVQDIISILIQSFIGTGVSANGFLNQKGLLHTPNERFFMPSQVGKLMGLTGVKAAKDAYRYLFGIQQYAGGSATTLSTGMNPSTYTTPYPGFYFTGSKCEGQTLLKPDYWNQVKTWDIMNQYLNAPLNEMYTCFRISPDNKVLPTLVLRQIPFTNDDINTTLANNKMSKVNLATTKFTTLPRWKINPAMVISRDIGRDEAARINFVQYFGRSQGATQNLDISFENKMHNYLYDIKDVLRSGLRPYVVQTDFEDPSAADKGYYRSPIWAVILGDAVIGEHLKFNGTIECVGIVPPIAVGDNLELDNIVYHIEQITHAASINGQDGRKTFRTVISLSHGISTDSSASGLRYAEMSNTNGYNERQTDFDNNQILPGVGEAQDTVYRPTNPEPTAAEISPPNHIFAQPNQNTSVGGSDDE